MYVFPLFGSPAITTHEKKDPSITARTDNETTGNEGGCIFLVLVCFPFGFLTCSVMTTIAGTLRGFVNTDSAACPSGCKSLFRRKKMKTNSKQTAMQAYLRSLPCEGKGKLKKVPTRGRGNRSQRNKAATIHNRF